MKLNVLNNSCLFVFMSKLFVQQCAILSLLLTRKLFQTGSPCFPFPSNSKIHNLTHVTVIFGWCSQPALHILKLSLTFRALKWFLELHQRSNILSSAGCWVNTSFSCWKKNEVEIARGIPLLLVLHLGAPCHRSGFTEAILILWIFLLWFAFLPRNLSQVLGSEIDF